jgi:adenine C2-methylase RlmN of 23S rRNA A2503 and tRNA A37
MLAHMRAKTNILDIHTKKPVITKVLVNRAMIFDVLDGIQQTLEELGIGTKSHIEVMNEIRFNASFSHEFRQNIYPELEEFLYELYAKAAEK